MSKRFLQIIAASALSLSIGACVAPQAAGQKGPVTAAGPLAGFWMPKNDREPYGQAVIDLLPKETHVLIDTGLVPELPIGDFGGLKVTQRALDEVRNFNPSRQRSPAEACIPPSMTYVMQAPFPMEIYVFPEVILIKHEYYDMIRVVFMDGRPHPPADVPHTKPGHSIGRWEGGDLVVDTTHLEPGTMLNNGFNHSENMHVVERFRASPDGSTLWVTQLYEDPAVFEGRAARYIAFKRGPADGYVYPFDCVPGYSSE
jgi:hypothetical protein